MAVRDDASFSVLLPVAVVTLVEIATPTALNVQIWGIYIYLGATLLFLNSFLFFVFGGDGESFVVAVVSVVPSKLCI